MSRAFSGGCCVWRNVLAGVMVLLSGLACDRSESESARAKTQALTTEDGSTGVMICDAYLDQYETCVIPSLPQSQVQRHRDGLIRQRTAWGSLTESPFKKEALARICSAAIETAQREFPGCAFSSG
jgi:hypothetical protein